VAADFEVIPDFYVDQASLNSTPVGITLTLRVSEPALEPQSGEDMQFRNLARIRISPMFAAALVSLLTDALDQYGDPGLDKGNGNGNHADRRELDSESPVTLASISPDDAD
jgi:hypothetical protein